MSSPINYLNKSKPKDLIGKPVLYSNRKEGLGTYGTLIGFLKNGLFVIKPDHAEYLITSEWIIKN